MNTQIDSFTIKDFESRYGVARSNIYNRINGLKDRGYRMEPEKQNGKSVFNADQIAVMDALDQHIKAGKEIAVFLAAHGQAELSYVSQDIEPADAAPPFGMASLIDAIAGKVTDILTLRQSEPLTPSSLVADPLANLRAIQEACDRGWELRTSQLEPLLGLKSLQGTELKRHGFTFTKVGKIGAESAWRISKD